jgi:hypothetical protein
VRVHVGDGRDADARRLDDVDGMDAMPGQTWPDAAESFLGMWVVMMVAIMRPSLVPMLWRYRQAVGRTGETRLGRLRGRFFQRRILEEDAEYTASTGLPGTKAPPIGIYLQPRTDDDLGNAKCSKGGPSPAELAEKTIDYAEARAAYFKALRAEVPQLMQIAMGKEARPA